MPRVLLLLATVVLIVPSPAQEPQAPAQDQPPTRKFQVVTPKDDGIIATDINERGDVIGFEWVEEKELPGVLSQVPFFAREGKGEAMTTIPLLPTYTATFPAAVSDTGVVVGRAGKPSPNGVRVPMRFQAFVWDEAEGIRGLGVLPDDWASDAGGVSRDGTRISGYSVGDNRRRACVWDRDGAGWKGTPLPHVDQLRSNVVAMSGDGNHVAAVDGLIPCLWTRGADGSWTREAIGEAGALVPRAVNDSGSVAGLRFTGDGMTHAVLWTREAGCKTLDKPVGFVSSEALAINNRGDVVGIVDGPHGSEIGPNAFVLADGRVRLIDEGGPFFSSATAINDRGQVAGVVAREDEEEPKPNPPARP